ncbi:phosphoethanolamine transferase EptA [Pectobacterium sp. B1J-3]|uniref:phosphoethanolamine transferase EptA n=1 Tax=Pectobacterium sp. B1J-3 TaxID=3385371 RepID=UPI003906498D
MKNGILLSRPRWSSLTFVLIFSAFITIAHNIAYYRQTLHLLDMASGVNVLFFLSMPVVIFAVLNIVFTLLAVPYLCQSIIIFFLLTGASAQYFMLNYGIVIDRTMVQNIIETTVSESLSLITPQFILWLFTLGVIPSIFAVWVKIKPIHFNITAIGIRILLILASLFSILIIAVFFYKDYASLMRNNKELVKSITPSNIVAASLSYYKHNALANLPLVKIGLDAHKKTLQQANGKKNLVILVIGETSRAQNFSLGGYTKETNPKLAKNNVIYFDNTVSCGTSTGVSVPCMFSNMPRQGFDGGLASHQEGLLDILQRAKVDVLWHENDGGCKDVCSRVPTVNITDLKLPNLCSGGNCYDEALFHDLDNYINKLDNDGIIVLHTMGSHGPSYYQRYPDTFKKFTPSCDTNQIQTCSQEELENTYDNTILYADYILDKAINLLKSRQDKFNTALVYLSDHGESLGEKGIYLHSMPYSIAPEQQTHVPMLMWFSEDYQKQFSIKENCLRNNAKQNAYSQDNLFHTILGMFNIETTEYHQQLDIIRPCQGSAS